MCDVLTAILITIYVFRVVSPCGMVNVYVVFMYYYAFLFRVKQS